MTDNTTTVTATITATQRMDSSVNGNPRYRLTTDAGTFPTGVDASIGYAITNREYNSGPVVLTLRNGQVIGAQETVPCRVCGEPTIEGARPVDITHTHGDIYCGTGDGSTASRK